MGKQTKPASIAALTDSLTRQDAEEMYGELSKRVLWDTLWNLVDRTGDHCHGDDKAIIASIWSLAKANR
jgi:trehalose-6-phosphate synthase